MHRSLFGGKTTTDEQGRFELNGLILGAEYEIDVQTGKYTYRNVDTITLDQPATKELGDLVYKQPDQSLTLELPRWQQHRLPEQPAGNRPLYRYAGTNAAAADR